MLQKVSYEEKFLCEKIPTKIPSSIETWHPPARLNFLEWSGEKKWDISFSRKIKLT